MVLVLATNCHHGRRTWGLEEKKKVASCHCYYHQLVGWISWVAGAYESSLRRMVFDYCAVRIWILDGPSRQPCGPSSSQRAGGPTWALFSFLILQILALCKKKISCHIKLTVHTWSTKCLRNQKLIAQFGCTLRDERFKSN